MNTRKFLLLDKSALMYLNEDLRTQLDSKHTMLYPPILFAEIAQHGLDQPIGWFNFKNTVNVIHWAQRAKIDLIKGVPSGHYNIGAKIPTTSIYENSEAERKELEEQAKDIVREIEAEEETLKKRISLLRNNTSKLSELAMNHREIPDEKIIREFNQAIRQSGQSDQNYPLSASADLIGGGCKSVAKVREVLDNHQDEFEMLFRVDTLEQAERWVEKVIYTDAESILDFICQGGVIPLSVNEQDEILNRFRREGKPHINDFAPYAKVVTQLYLIIFLYLVENKENSSRKGDLKDFEYLYYATDTNVIFISGDNSHKRFIEEIPLLKNIQKNFKFLPDKKENEEEFKKVLNSIGIKA